MQTDEMEGSRPPLGGIFWGIVLNAIIPVGLYKLSRRYVSPSEFTGLLIDLTHSGSMGVGVVERDGEESRGHF